MGNVKKSVAERTRHKRQYDKRIKERQMRSRERTYITHVVDADIRPVNDQEASAEVYLTAQHNVLANEQQHTDQFEPSYDTYLLEKVDSNTTPNSTNMCHRGGEIDQDIEQDQIKSSLLNAEFLKTNDMVEKEVYNELSNRFLQLEKHFTPHYLPKVREYVLAKPHHVIAPGSSRNSQEESYGLHDMAHSHYLEEARKKTQERNRNLKSSSMHTTSLQITTNDSKQKPRSNNHTSRSLHVSKSSGLTLNGVTLVDHSMNSSSFLDSKHFVFSTCQKCVFDANHDDCITKFLKEVNSHAKVQSSKSRNNIKPAKRIPNVKNLKDGSQKDIGFLPISLSLCMRNQTLLDLVLGGNRRVEFSRLLVLGGYLLERCLSIAQPRLTVNP
nr:hypothetical protein [Tanacetum cinerariifolium]